MKDEEMVQLLKQIEQDLRLDLLDREDPHGHIADAHCDVVTLLAALEANLLAEVEGWLGKQAQAQVSTKPEEWGLPGIFINFGSAGDEVFKKLGYVPVTVTIRGRGDVPEPPAISSSIR